MVDTDPSLRSSRTSVPVQPDWADQAADTVERVVGSVRDKTTGPALTVARGLVYGTFAALVGLTVLVMFTIMAIRLIDVYLPDAVFGESHTWAAHLLVGLVFVIIGGMLFSQRGGSAEQSQIPRR